MRSRQNGKAKGTLRVIGGEWRGRKLDFPSLEGLRPTTDRVRETAFNWLAPRLQGARCLDMFAGSGALGIEALSRGADWCDFIDNQAAVVKNIAAHLITLNATDRGRVTQTSGIQWSSDRPYDIVFIDPPFDLALCEQALNHLLEARLLTEDGRVYLELGRSQTLPSLAPHWDCLRDKQAGDVRYLLLAPTSP